jgi:hypothetical protein
MADVRIVAERTVLVCDPAGPPIIDAQGALDIIGQAWAAQADLIVLPVSRLTDDFFTLSTGLAGEVLQKFVNYHLQLAIVGAIGDHVAASSALRAFVSESNQGRHVWFLDDVDQVFVKLEPAR